MNENFQRMLQNMTAFFAGLSMQKKIALGVTAVLTVAWWPIGFCVAKHDPYEVVFTDMQVEDAKAIEKKLGELNIPFTVSEDGSIGERSRKSGQLGANAARQGRDSRK